jgi:hypothetical protein
VLLKHSTCFQSVISESQVETMHVFYMNHSVHSLMHNQLQAWMYRSMIWYVLRAATLITLCQIWGSHSSDSEDPVPLGCDVMLLDEWSWHFKGLSLCTQRQAKGFLIRPSAKRPGKLLSLTRNQLEILTGLRTGNCNLKGHLLELGLVHSLKCDRYKRASEMHLCDCEALAT